MTTYWVRPARPADLKAVRELARRVRREHRLAVRESEPTAAGGVDDRMWVVEAGRAEIVGSCGVGERPDGVWELHSLFLAPEWRGFGLGRALVERALDEARRGGGLSVACDVPGELPEAAGMLRRLGFEPEGADALAPRRFVKPLGRAS